MVQWVMVPVHRQADIRHAVFGVLHEILQGIREAVQRRKVWGVFNARGLQFLAFVIEQRGNARRTPHLFKVGKALELGGVYLIQAPLEMSERV
jgi:hypothetical protein